MATQPLDAYFALGGANPGLDLKWPPNCTALWRGYIGSWEILDQRLYLIKLMGDLSGNDGVCLATVFPDFPDRVFAHWYSGTLRIPDGAVLKYVHQSYQSTHERDFLIEVEGGMVVNTDVRFNQLPAD